MSRAWVKDGTWKRIHDDLVKQVRKGVDKKPTPTAAIIDSQSVRSAEGGLENGYDAGKKVTGRKRHIAVDSLGMLLVVVVHSASIQDYDGAKSALEKLRNTFRRRQVVFADGADEKCGLPNWTATQCQCRLILQTVLRPVGVKGFVILPKRWIVERTLAWLSRHRRTSKDYERLPENSEAVCDIAMIDSMTRRLASA